MPKRKKGKAENYLSIMKKISVVITDCAPIFVPLFLTFLGCALTALLLMSWLYSYLVVLAAIAAILLSFIVTRKLTTGKPASKPTKEYVIVNMLVFVFVVMWTGYNMRFASQHVYVNRDPAVYANAAAWLRENPGLKIPNINVFGDEKGIKIVGAGFSTDTFGGQTLYAQGMHVVPAFLGSGARLLGDASIFYLAPIFGGTALLAVFAFARLLVKPRWALLAVVAFGCTLPLIYFSRDVYTEPLSATYIFGGLAVLWLAYKQKQRWLWLVAGLAGGAAVLTRTDAYLAVAALVGAVGTIQVIEYISSNKKPLKDSLFFYVGIAASTLLGWLDLTRLSSGYYRDLRDEVMMELLLTFAVIVGLIIAGAICWRFSLVKWLDAVTKKWRVLLVVVLLSLLVIGIASRPFWMVGRSHRINITTEGLQGLAGLPIDGTRTYAEQSATWVTWYIGPLMALLGGAGFVVMGMRIFQRKNLKYLPFFAVFAVTSLLFLLRPKIALDQIWAARRYLPVTIPGLILLGVFCAEYIYGKLPNLTPWIYKSSVALLWAGILVPILFISQPFLAKREFAANYYEISTICKSLPSNAAVVWVGRFRLVGVQPTQFFCDKPAASLKEPITQEKLDTVGDTLRAEGYTPVVGVTGVEEPIYLPPGSQMTEVSNITFETIPGILVHPPRHTEVTQRTVFLGVINKNGVVLPLSSN